MAGTISVENGKKGGRPKSSHTIETEAAKKLIAEMVNAKIVPMIEAQIKKAEKGDKGAFDSLMDRAHGRPAQSVEIKGDIVLKLDV